ncbi:molecular chaperone DnaK [Helicobacter pylori]|nr:molecular chaperone DnaK [Helicobacter pylori]TPI03340.1 molecular chaperone DnaK [Helicobacter pylori]UOS46982.1 molecular chaperone DnaK [Helicobacter pylori]WRB69424.1 molecular chaperone DnaK [Helicobacter pylori]WRB70811.1 molecular chaperone DnaK [Helicobacter pylori]WRF53237.1 molecular chaperone DnaK [Helicobacter pylori]
MIIKIVQSQEVGLEISKTQILHENINKSGYRTEQGKLFDYDLHEILL